MDKIYIFLIPFIYVFRLKLTILIVDILFVSNPSEIGRALKNGLAWNNIFSLHMILFDISGLHSLAQIPIIKFPIRIFQKLSIVRLCLYWPKFHFIIFKQNYYRRPFWELITNAARP